MSFFKLKECDVISTKFTAHPSYRFPMADFRSDETIFVFNSTSVGLTRTFSDINGNPVTGSYNLSGNLEFLQTGDLTTREKTVLQRLRNTYATASFLREENYSSSSLFDVAQGFDQTMHILNIPQVVYGSGIQPGSFLLQTNSGHEYTDDTRGGIFSGALHVGCLFYQHGIAYFGSKFSTGGLANVTASFSGTSITPVNIYLCRVPRGLLNFSNNPSYTTFLSGTSTNETTTKEPKTFVTGVGLYDSEYKLVGVAKVSTPILNEEDTGLLFKLKLAF